MVKTEVVELYICPYCSAKFNDNLDCAYHIEETHTDSPISVKETIFKCGVCNEIFHTYKDAVGCETIHASGNDLKYQAFLHQQAIDKLIEAGNHPSQKKIERF